MSNDDETILIRLHKWTARGMRVTPHRATTGVGIDRRRLLHGARRYRSRKKPGRVLVISRDLVLWRGRGGAAHVVDSDDKPAA
jgi:hypothetical protein